MFCSQFDNSFAPISWTKYFEERFRAFCRTPTPINISTKFSTFHLFVILLIKFILQVFNHQFNFWLEFSFLYKFCSLSVLKF